MSRVVRSKKRSTFNIGLFIFSIIFLYVAISVLTFVNKKRIALYEVESGSIIEQESFTGLIIRDEMIVYSHHAGYINYYFREGEKAAKNSFILTISQDNHQMIQEKSGLTKDQMSVLKEDIGLYNSQIEPSNFEKIYELKNVIDSQLLEYQQISETDGLILEQEVEGQTIYRNSTSGLISYILDGFESISMDEVTDEIFNKEIERQTLLAQKEVEENAPLYKLIDPNTWSIVFLGSEQLSEYLQDKEQLTIRLNKDGLAITGEVSYIQNGGKTYTVLTFERFVNRYIHDRFLDFDVVYQEVSGLKIPNSAIVTKPFYKIPEAYVTTSGQEKGLLKTEVINGMATVNFVPLGTYYYDGEFYYIRTDQVDKLDQIQQPESEDVYIIETEVLLEGVYDGNRGYAYFDLIDKLYSTEEYSIVKTNIPYGLRLYDHIIIESQLVEENEVIY